MSIATKSHHAVCLPFILTLSLAPSLLAQTSAVPSQYQDLYTQMQSSMQAFEANLPTTAASAPNFAFTGELLNANGNIGLSLLKSTTRPAYLQELQALKSLGMTAVTVNIGFPELYQPFYQFNGDPQDYASMLAFYQQLVADIHASGMKMVVESQSLFPGYYTSAAGFNIKPFYQTLTTDTYEQAHATQAATIYNMVKPDFLDLGSEPDTEALNTGFSEFSDPTVWTQRVTAAVNAIGPAPHNPPLGTGVGNWQVTNGTTFIADEAAIPGIDYIDLHLYPVTNIGDTNTLNYVLTLVNAAKAAGKPIAMSEYWLLKLAAYDPSTDNPNNPDNPATASLNAYSFWQPLDEELIADLVKLANANTFLYASAFWTRYFWAYVPYTANGPAPGAALDQAGAMAAAAALDTNQRDATSIKVAVISGAEGSLTASSIGSSANFTTSVAVGSLASVFGTNLAATTTEATGALTSTLGGVSIAVFNTSGPSLPADIIYVSPGQINFVVPSGLLPGPATVAVTNGSASVQGTLNLTATAPGLFSANGTGAGLAAGLILTVTPDGTQTYTNVFSGCTSTGCVPVPVNVSSGNQVYLVLFGTGISGASAGSVSAMVNGQQATTQYAGAQGQYPGLDQVNVLLPSSLAGAGMVNVQVAVGGPTGLTSNTVQVQIQ